MQRLLFLVLLLLGSRSQADAQLPQHWQRRLGSRTVSENNSALLRTRSNRLVAVGSANVNGGFYAAALWLLSHRGDSLHRRTYPSAPRESEDMRVVAEAPDGDLLLFGTRQYALPGGSTTQLDHVLWRTDSLGNLRWRQVISSPRALTCDAVQALPDGGALLVGSTNHPQGTIFAPITVVTVWRVDALGNVLWQRVYGNPYAFLTCITPLADGSYALGGTAIYNNGGNIAPATWVVRLNADGDTIRTRRYLPPIGVKAIAPAPNNGVVIAGSNQVQGLDSLDQFVWFYEVASLRAGAPSRLNYVRALADPGPTGARVLVGGMRSMPLPTPTTTGPEGYLALIQGYPGLGYGNPLWQQQINHEVLRNQAVTGPGNTLTLSRSGYLIPTPRQLDLELTRYSNVPALYEAPLCRTPPQALFSYAFNPAGDELTFQALALAGPPYAQVVAWRWQLGDGSTFTGPLPPPHFYPVRPAPGTPVSFTVTNNLGCAHTTTLYPWGAPTASRQALALASQAALFPNPSAGPGPVSLQLAGLPPGPVRVQVLDALGRPVGAQAASAGPSGTALLQLDGAALPPGVYAVRVHTPAGSFTKKLVRQ